MIKNIQPWQLFDKRIRSAAELKRLLPFERKSPEDLQITLEKGNPGTCAIYVHIPFCVNNCDFCGYYKCAKNDSQIEAYTNKLINEIELTAQTNWSQNQTVKAIYFGGGTPTTLKSTQLVSIIETIAQYSKLSSNCEITIESSIKEIDELYISNLKAGGVNRISLGIQSFDNEVRTANSRRAKKDEITNIIDQIKHTGIPNLCVDLIYNLKEQSIDSWFEDLNIIKSNDITGASIYPLLPFPNAPIVLNKEFTNLTPQQEFEYSKIADDFLTNLPGWDAFTPVQYGHKVKGQAKYIEMQANGDQILAFGPGAGGKIHELQYLNQYDLNTYLNHSFDELQAKKIIFSYSDPVNELTPLFILCRSLKVAKPEIQYLIAKFQENFKFLFKNDLIAENKSFYYLTQNGKYWAVNILASFLGKQTFNS